MRLTDIQRITAAPENAGEASDPALDAFWDAQESTLVRSMLGTAGHVAMSDLGVRIVGERGSGKLQLARLIHSKSSRAEFGFHHVICSKVEEGHTEATLFGREVQGESALADQSIPGVLELSSGGTVYLEDYPVLSEEMHFRLWRAMELKHLRRMGGSQEVNINVRMITGISKNAFHPGDPRSAESETSRKISPICINIPPLRERKEDLEGLIYLFIGHFSRKNDLKVLGVTSKVLECCRSYDWPGNIYELRNVIFHCAARTTGELMEFHDLPEFLRNNYSMLPQAQ